jgi:hypothetical protein
MNPTIHDEAELWAAAAATGGLTAAQLKAWRAHLQACPACQKLQAENLTMADLIKKTLEADRQSDSHSPDAGFEQRIISRLDQAGMAKGNRWYEYLLFHPGLTAAACLLVAAMAGTGWLLHRETASKFAASAAVTPAKPAAPNLQTNPPRIDKVPAEASPQGQRSGIATAATTPPPAMESSKAGAGDRGRSPVDLRSVAADSQPPSAPAKGLSIGEGTRIMNNNSQPTFSLTNPNTKYILEPATEQKIETITAAQPPILQGISVTAVKEVNPPHHHKHRHPHHHRRHHRRHHHPATSAAVTLLIPLY